MWWRSLGAVVVAAGVGACSSDGATQTTAVPPSTAAPATTEVSEGAGTEAPPATAVPDGPLAEVCPDVIVVQLDTLPTVRTGPLFALIGDGATIDDVRQHVSGPLRRADGTSEDVTLELRSGGPAVSFRPALSVQTSDPSVHLADTSFSDLAIAADSTATAIVALAATNDVMIMWDPVTNPDIEDLDTLRTSGIDVLHLVDEPVIEFLTATGVLDAEQLRPGAESGVAGFITAAGSVARQGDAVIDPLLFPSIPQWGRPIRFAAASTRGWLDVDHLVATTEDRLGEECLGRLVPIVQRAVIAYDEDPSGANELMATARLRFNPLTRVTAEVLDDSVVQAQTTGLSTDGYTDVIGGFDPSRLEAFAVALGTALDTELRPIGDVLVDRFLDPTLTPD